MNNPTTKYLCECGYYHSRDELEHYYNVHLNAKRTSLLFCKEHHTRVLQRVCYCMYEGCGKEIQLSLKGIPPKFCTEHTKAALAKSTKKVSWSERKAPLKQKDHVNSEIGWNCVHREKCLDDNNALSLRCETCKRIKPSDKWRKEVSLTKSEDKIIDFSIY